MFDQLLLRHRALLNTPAPSSPDRLRGGLGALLTVGANVLGVGGNNTVAIHQSTSFASSTRSLRGLRSNGDKRASIPASFFGAERKGSLSPKKPPRTAGGGSRSSESSNTASEDRDSTSRPRAGTAPGSVGAGANSAGGTSSPNGAEARSRPNSIVREAPSGDGGGIAGAFDGFRGFFGGGTRAERLSVIADDESFAGSTMSTSLRRGEVLSGTHFSQDSRGKATSTSGAREEGVPDLQAALAPKDGSEAAELEKLARVAAQQGRSFSTVEGDSSDEVGAVDYAGAAAERDTEKAVGGKAARKPWDGDEEENDDGSGSHNSTEKDADEEEEEEVLTRETLCPVLEDQVLDNVFKIFDLNNNGSVTKEVRGPACSTSSRGCPFRRFWVVYAWLRLEYESLLGGAVCGV